MSAITTVAPTLEPALVCRALRLSRATWYRRRRPPVPRAARPRSRPPRALSQVARQQVREALCSPRFVAVAPAEAVATLLDDGVYLASRRTLVHLPCHTC